MPEMKTKCPVCEENGNVASEGTRRGSTIYNCPRCKRYEITEEAEIALKNNPSFKNKKYILIGVLRNRRMSDESILLNRKNIQDLIDSAPIPIDPFDAIDKILFYIYQKSNSVSSFVEIKSTDFPIVYGKNPEDLMWYIDHAINMEYIEKERISQIL